jgi:ectoine hydroxylase-related dioxygenase (phytanoyl-CoA dioxygenase family)
MKSDSELATQYARDGFLVEPHLLTVEECAALKAEAQCVLRDHATGKGTVYVGAAVASSLFRALASHPRIVDVLSAIMPDGIAFMSDKIVFKSHAQRYATPWHNDQFYWRNTRPKLSVWIALDEVTAANGALKVLPGSHLHEWEAIRSDGVATDGNFVNVVNETSWKPEDEVVCEIPAGGAIFFSDRLLHASTPNDAGADRYSIISTYHAPAADEQFDLQFAARHVIKSVRE